MRRLPRLGASKLVERWLYLTLFASVASMLSGGWLARWTALAPGRIWHGEVWRLVTWGLVEPGPYSLFLTCIAIYKFGGELAPRWGDRRLRRFMLELVVGVAAVTTLLALVFPSLSRVAHTAGWAIDDILCIAWARQYPHAVLNISGLLPVSGKQLIAITIGLTVLFALAYGPLVMAPELLACLAAAYYPIERLAQL
jgi:hypothetical protein